MSWNISLPPSLLIVAVAVNVAIGKLYFGEFEILEFQAIAHVGAEGEQGNGDLGDHSGVIVLNIGVVASDINDGTEHRAPLSG